MNLSSLIILYSVLSRIKIIPFELVSIDKTKFVVSIEP